MKKNSGTGSPVDAEQIVGAALAAFGQGAGDRRMNAPAIESFHNQFIPKICLALERPGWQAAWRREKAYMLAYAEAMGQRAAKAAAEEGRPFITHQDVTFATTKLRGYMPIAGRWCPL
jgi:hypothetical protein